MPVDIVPIEEGHIEGFHRTLDFVARERRYLSFLEAPPLESFRGFVLDAAQAFGLHRVELTVRENNTGAVKLYKRAGFEVEGLHRDAVQVDGVYENVLFMAVLF